MPSVSLRGVRTCLLAETSATLQFSDPLRRRSNAHEVVLRASAETGMSRR